MNNLPPLLAICCGVNKCDIDLYLEPSLRCFEGHFPDMPVLPGVVQLDWAVRLAKTHLVLDDELVASRFEVLKYQQLLVPGLNVKLQLEKKGSDKVLFSYLSERGQYASGRIVFEVRK